MQHQSRDLNGGFDTAPRSEWRRNWPVVTAGAAGGCLATLHLYSTGVMIEPLEREFGWSRAQVSSGLTIVAAAGVLLSSLIGVFVDRVGARRVALLGAVIFCCFVAALSQIAASIWQWWALWIGIAISGACIAPTVWAAGVSSLFVKSRGMALAITLSGTSIGAMIVPVTTQALIAEFGWRGAYLGLAGIWGLVVLPVVYFGFASAKDRDRISGRGTAKPGADASPSPSAWGEIRSWRFVKLTIGAIAIVTVASSLLANIVPILTDEGYQAGRAAAIAGLVGVGSLIGRLCGGLLLDRIDGRFVAGFSVLMPVGSCLILLWAPESATAVSLGVFLLGLAVGIEWDAVAYLASRHFGLRHFGAVFGTIGGLALLMTGLGPFITNHVYDVAGSYEPAMWAFIPLCLVSSAFFLLLGPYKEPLAGQH